MPEQWAPCPESRYFMEEDMSTRQLLNMTMGAFAMLLAIVATLIDQNIVSYYIIAAGMIVGGAIGLIMALKVEMTGMPQMVAMLNGFGGGASLLVAGAALIEAASGAGAAIRAASLQFAVATSAAGVIGAVTFLAAWLRSASCRAYCPVGHSCFRVRRRSTGS